MTDHATNTLPIEELIRRKEISREAVRGILTDLENGITEVLRDVGKVITVTHDGQHEHEHEHENERESEEFHYSYLAISQEEMAEQLHELLGMRKNKRQVAAAMRSLESRGVLLVDRDLGRNRPHVYYLDWSRHMSLDEQRQYDPVDVVKRLVRQRDREEDEPAPPWRHSGTTGKPQWHHSGTTVAPQPAPQENRSGATATRVPKEHVNVNTDFNKIREHVNVNTDFNKIREHVNVNTCAQGPKESDWPDRPWDRDEGVTSEQLAWCVRAGRTALLRWMFEVAVELGWWADNEDNRQRYMAIAHHCATDATINSPIRVFVSRCKGGDRGRLNVGRVRHESDDWAAQVCKKWRAKEMAEVMQSDAE